MPDLHAYHQSGEADVQLVQHGPRGADRLVLTVPMPRPTPGETLGVMVDGREWLVIEQRPQHHPAPYR